MKLFSNRKQTANELLPALVVVDGTLSQRLEGKENVRYNMDILGVVALDNKACFHCRIVVVILGGGKEKPKTYSHDMLVNDDNVDDQINGCILCVTEQLTLAGL